MNYTVMVLCALTGLLTSQTHGAQNEAPVSGRVLIVRDGVSVDVAGKSIGLKKGEMYPATVTAAKDGFEFSVELAGGKGVLPKTDAAFSTGKDGACFKMRLSDAAEAKLVELRGNGETEGESVTVSGTWDPKMTESLCLVLDEAMMLEAEPPYQIMVTRPKLAGRWKPGMNAEEETAATIEVKPGEATSIEAYCSDADLETPEPTTVFAKRSPAPPHLAKLMASMVGKQVDPGDVLDKVWEAESEFHATSLKAGDWLIRTVEQEERVTMVDYEFPEAITFRLLRGAKKDDVEDDEFVAAIPGGYAVGDDKPSLAAAKRLAPALMAQNVRPGETHYNAPALRKRFGAGLKKWLTEQGDVDDAKADEIVKAGGVVTVKD